MSKAFTREDDQPEQRVARRLASPLPPGAKNYLTAAGAERLRAELDHLVNVERAQLALAEPASVREKLEALDQRIEHLHHSLESAVVVERPAAGDDRVRFGATVTVREPGGEESTYRIVGVDEADADRGWVSWVSPIAKALVNARLGERVRLRLPGGEKVLAITRVVYE